MTYGQTINFLYNLERFGIQFGLKKIIYLLALLDNPQNTFKSIHIAGTNGKGSTSSFIASILKEAGFKTGLYTSPHLVDFRERIQINGVLIPRRKLTEIVEKLIPLVKKTNRKLGDLTYFEVATAIAFEYFKDEEVDFACVEVGMGGRLDATNVINPMVSVITGIGFDHTKELGNTLERIAYEKAGIIKKNGILVCGVTDKEPLKMIKKICLKNNAEIYLLGKDFKGKFLSRNGLKSQRFSYKSIWSRGERPFALTLLGECQIQNASLAVAVCEILVFQRGIKKGLENARWPGRFEIIGRGTARRPAPYGSGCRVPTIILDGAHNPSGANKLFKSLKQYFPNKKINFVLGILKDKDIFGIIKEIMPLADKIIVSSPHCDRAFSLDELAGIVRKFNKDVEAVYPMQKAIKHMVENVSKNAIICITGSLYTVGGARKWVVERGNDKRVI
ncbi:MAG: folylpolyglutamate synthase/dihydrofolate synthase family protein [bacterium]